MTPGEFGDATEFTAGLAECFTPEAWAKLLAEVPPVQIIPQVSGVGHGCCERCGALVYVGYEAQHEGWHRGLSLVIRALGVMLGATWAAVDPGLVEPP